MGINSNFEEVDYDSYYIAMAVYLSLNTVMNFISKSRKERYIMTPLSAITAVCFWITAL